MPYLLPVHQILAMENRKPRIINERGSYHIIVFPYPADGRVRVKTGQYRIMESFFFLHILHHFCAAFCACQVCGCCSDTNLGLKIFNLLPTSAWLLCPGISGVLAYFNYSLYDIRFIFHAGIQSVLYVIQFEVVRHDILNRNFSACHRFDGRRINIAVAEHGF